VSFTRTVMRNNEWEDVGQYAVFGRYRNVSPASGFPGLNKYVENGLERKQSHLDILNWTFISLLLAYDDFPLHQRLCAPWLFEERVGLDGLLCVLLFFPIVQMCRISGVICQSSMASMV